MPRYDVVGLGTAACDYLVALDRFPGPDEKVRTGDLVVQGGGTVGTALVTVARLGLTTAWAGALGEDEFGRLVLASLESEGVDTRHVRTHDGARSPFSFCVSVPPARNVFSVAPTTPPFAWKPGELDAVLESRYVHLDGGEEQAALELAREARKRGVGVSLDLQRTRPGTDELLSLADVVVVGEPWARERFGAVAPAEAARRLHRPGMTLAAVTLGPNGCVATEGGEPYAIPAEAVEVVDTTGAGDVFHGALLVGLLGGHKVPDCVRIATHVAGLACRALGGRAAIPRRDEVGDLL